MKDISFYMDQTSSAEADWRQRANCRNVPDPDLFFPIGSNSQALEQTARAKKICAACEVRRTCLQWALNTHQDVGVWGGLSEEERRALVRRYRRTVLTTA